jgi:hypothetical protein
MRVVVPYREQAGSRRADHLAALLPTLPADVDVVIAVQTDDGRKFNRGALCNAGAAVAPHAAAVLFHDVDLVPSRALVADWYGSDVTDRPLHLAAAWGKYTYAGYKGGVLKVSMPHFMRANGFPNTFWGWGGEDDALARRLARVGVPAAAVPPSSPDYTYTDLEETLPGPGPRACVRVADGGDAALRNMTRVEDLERDELTWRDDGLASLTATPTAVQRLAPNVRMITFRL